MSRSIAITSSPRRAGEHPGDAGVQLLDLRPVTRRMRSAPSLTAPGSSATRSRPSRRRTTRRCRAGTLAHEIAHEWFGNSLSLKVWPDMLAERGLRPLLRVDVDGEPRHPHRRAGVHHGLQPLRHQLVLADPADRHAGSECALHQRGLPARRDDAPGPPRGDGELAFWQLMRGWAARQPVRQREHRRLIASPSSGRPAWISTRSSTSGSSSPASRPPGRRLRGRAPHPPRPPWDTTLSTAAPALTKRSIRPAYRVGVPQAEEPPGSCCFAASCQC